LFQSAPVFDPEPDGVTTWQAAKAFLPLKMNAIKIAARNSLAIRGLLVEGISTPKVYLGC
jgi:hypothetical protein